MREMLERLSGKLKQKGASGDIQISLSKSLKLSSQKNALSEFKVSSSKILGLRAIKDNRVGISFTESFDEESLDRVVKESLENAAYSLINEDESILSLSGELLDLHQPPLESVDIETKIEKALFLESAPKEKDARVVAVPYNSFSENEFEHLYLSTQGRFTHFSDHVFSISTSALMEEKGKKALFYDYHSSHNYHELDWNKVINQSLYHASHLLQEKPLMTKRYTVTFGPDVLKQIFECFSHFFSAKAVLDKINPWEGRLNQEVMPAYLSLYDVPEDPRFFRAKKFDSEGVASKKLTVIREGRLETFLHNSITAKKLNTVNTGHAYRANGGAMGVSSSHFLIHSDQKFSKPQNYIEIIQVDGLYSGANRVTGNFSVGIKGYLYENGVRTLTFGNSTLSANFAQLLLRACPVEGLDQLSTDQSFSTIPLFFDDFSVAGI
jgi:PmbA protein